MIAEYNGVRVLYMDDDFGAARLAQKRLERAGYGVDIACNGAEGLHMYTGGAYRAIVVDQNMPMQEGLDVIRVLAEQATLPPTVMVTGAGSEQVAVEAMKLGASDYLVKDAEGSYLDLLPLVIERALHRQRLFEEKQQAEEALRHSHALLEQRVQERTAELARANRALQAEIAERQQAQERSERQLRHLSALRQIDIAITASLDLRLTFSVLLDQVLAHMGVDAAALLRLNPQTHTLDYVAQRGFVAGLPQQTAHLLDDNGAGRAVLERRLISIPDARKEPEIGQRIITLLLQEGFVSYYAMPLIARGQVQGVLELFGTRVHTSDAEWCDLLDTLAGQAAIAVDNAELFARLQRTHDELALAYDATIEGWAQALELRDADTEGHTRRVTDMTVRLAQWMGIGDAELVHIYRGAILHDIGKLAIPDNILLKPGPLTADEWVIMRQHPLHARRLLSRIPFLRPALDIPTYHHEKWDGMGYPYGMCGVDIPLAARIFAVVDVWDALISDRPYHKAWATADVVAHMLRQAGSHFDPDVVDAFLAMRDAERSEDQG